MRNTHSLLLPALLLIAVQMAACIAPAVDTHQSPANPGSATEVAHAPLKISVAPFLSNSAFYIAYEEGFFIEEGLDIEIVQMNRASDAIPALAQGEIDVMSGNLTAALLNVIVRDANVRLVASTAQRVERECVYSGLMIRPGTAVDEADEMTAEIIQSLRYYNIPTNVGSMVLEQMLMGYGLTLNDIETIELPGQSAMLDPLMAGTIDVITASEPWVTRARTAGAAEVWWDHEEILPDSQASVLAFGPSILERNPELGERFMVAFLRGVQQYEEGKTERNLDILEQHLELEREILEELCLPHIPADGMILTDSIEEFSAWAAGYDYMDAPLSADMFWEPRFVEYANRTLGE